MSSASAAFVLPLLSLLATRPSRPAPRTARVLILAPTRELAAQIADSVRAYGSHMRPSVAVVVGGVKPGAQIKAMSRGVDFLIATPGRLLDHMDTRAISLADTTAVVLDEADQMMDLGFMPAIRKVMSAVPSKRQTILFSATMPKPIRALADDFLRDPVEIAVTPQAKPIERIEQAVYMIKGQAKPDFLAALLAADDMDRAIVFTRTKHGADKVVKHLGNNGLYAEAIHGNKSQNQRIRALDAFKTGKAPILVATDIAARGIDVEGVSHVINFDMPNISESYVHRIGRTARAGKSGIAISLVGNDERAYLRDIEKLTGKAIPRLDPPAGTALDLSLPEEEGPHKQQRNGGRSRPGGGGSRGGQSRNNAGGGKPRAHGQGGKPKSTGSSGGGKKFGGKPGGQRSGSGGGGNVAAPARSRGSWSPASS
jgi:ATP-dependent RNA helicase RhlE